MAGIEDIITSFPKPPRKQPQFAQKLPVGLRFQEIRAGQRRPKHTDPELAKLHEDQNRISQLIADELLAIREALRRWGILDESGLPTREGTGGSGGGGPGAGDQLDRWGGGGGNLDIGKLWAWIQNANQLFGLIEKYIRDLYENKFGGRANANSIADLNQTILCFHRGRFFNRHLLDKDSMATLTFPGTLTATDLPPVAEAWQNRMFADLKDSRKLYVVETAGSWAQFICVNPVAWFHDSDRFKILDATSLCQLRLGYGLTWYDFPLARGAANELLQVNGSGVVSWKSPTLIVTGVSHSVLADLGADDHTHYFLADGTRKMAGDIDVDGHVIKDTSVTDRVDIDDDCKVIGDLTVTGKLFNGALGPFISDPSIPRIDLEDTVRFVDQVNKTLFTDGNGDVSGLLHDAAVPGVKVMMNAGGSGKPAWNYPRFDDRYFELWDDGDPTTGIKFNCAPVSSGNIRTIQVPNHDVAKEAFMYIGGSPPTAAEGKLWWHSNHNELYLYDDTRAKWLGVSTYAIQFGIDDAAHGTGKLHINNHIPCATGVITGFHCWQIMTVVAWYIRLKANATANIRFDLIKNAATSMDWANVPNGSAFFTKALANADFAVGDLVSLYQNTATATDRPHGMVFLKRRGV